jgi:hypothetical protein
MDAFLRRVVEQREREQEAAIVGAKSLEGCTPKAVHNPVGNRVRIADDVRAQILQLAAQGMDSGKIGKIVGVRQRTAWMIIHRARKAQAVTL